MNDSHIKQNNGHRVSSGEVLQDGSVTDYSITTDNHQGIVFLQDGRHNQRCRTTSQELCGEYLEDKQSPAKTIEAVNGNIHLRAKNGEIILEAANIRIVGLGGNGGEVTIQAGKIMHCSAPIFGVQASHANIAGSSQVNQAGGFVSNVGSAGAETVSDVDATSSSIIGQILQAITKFKEFFSSTCSDSSAPDATAGANDATGATPGNVA